MENPIPYSIIWSGYFRYKATLRGFHIDKVERILRYSTEWYLDVITGRTIVVGRHEDRLIPIAFELSDREHEITPVTIHATTRQQINFRFQTGRYFRE